MANVSESLRQAFHGLEQNQDWMQGQLGDKMPWHHQVGVLEDFHDYLGMCIGQAEDRAGAGRIIQPPRTGKTFVAAKIIAATKLHAAYFVPSLALVDQTKRELRAALPGVPIGTANGHEQNLVEHGVNIVTYQLAQRQSKLAELPAELQRAALVFADEGHATMTVQRQQLLNAFDPAAVRIALTGTPDYGEDRVLAQYFPSLIHEITLREAIELDLLAHTRMWVAEVDADASQVTLRNGDFEEEMLGRLMSSAPFFQAALRFRYDRLNREKGALICCKSKAQAQDLLAYFLEHRPRGTTEPVLITADTHPVIRRAAIEAYDEGKIDTLINIGVLLTGFDAKRCKVLIDLAPGISLVRSQQKYSRPMTKSGDEEAHIFVILPKNLPGEPILPSDLFGESKQEYIAGELLAAPKQTRRPKTPSPTLDASTIKDVKLVERIRIHAEFTVPLLDRTNLRQIRAVLRSQPLFKPGLNKKGFAVFRNQLFRHSFFTGRGAQLLRYLSLPVSTEGYDQLMRRLFPEEIATRWILRHQRYEEMPGDSFTEDLRIYHTALERPGDKLPDESIEQSYLAFRGGVDPETPEELLLQKLRVEEVRLCAKVFGTHAHDRMVIMHRYGLEGEEEKTLAKISGEMFGLSRERVRQMEARGHRELREMITPPWPEIDCFFKRNILTEWWEMRDVAPSDWSPEEAREKVSHFHNGIKYTLGVQTRWDRPGTYLFLKSHLMEDYSPAFIAINQPFIRNNAFVFIAKQATEQADVVRFVEVSLSFKHLR